MTAHGAAVRVLGVCAAAASLACATAAPAPGALGCVGLTPPHIVSIRPVDLPASFAAVRLAGELPAEIVVAPDGTVGNIEMRTSDLSVLTPFATETLKRTRYAAGAFEGNPVAIRVPVEVPIGGPRHAGDPRGPAEVWAHVAPGQSREARWQLRDSVSWLTVLAHAPKLEAPGGEIVAVAPDGQTKMLVEIPASRAPQEIRQTVATGKFLAAAGAYRLELRAASKVLASARLTIADEYRDAVINSCDTLFLPRKTGPGN